MKLKNILNGEVVNDCEDIARIMKKIDKYIIKLEEENNDLKNEIERLEEIIERHAIQYE